MSNTAAAPSPYYTPEHEAFRETVRRFVVEEHGITIASWDDSIVVLVFSRMNTPGLRLPECTVGITCEYIGFLGRETYRDSPIRPVMRTCLL